MVILKKIALLFYRIKANIQVILMGKSGNGKKALVIEINHLLNNGRSKIEIINILPVIIDEILFKIMKEKDEKLKNWRKRNFG